MSQIYNDWVALMQPIFARIETEDVYQDMIGIGQDMRIQEDVSRWVQGDLSDLIIRKHGKEMLEDYANQINKNPKTLGNYRTICNFWELETRWDLLLNNGTDNDYFLTWSHFREAMSYGKRKKNDPQERLQEASRLLVDSIHNEWTVRGLQREIIKRLGDEPEFTKLDDMRGKAQKQNHGLVFVVTEGDASVIAPDEEYRIVVYRVNKGASV